MWLAFDDHGFFHLTPNSLRLTTYDSRVTVATAVLDLDFAQLPLEVKGLDRYSQAYILIRLRGHPVGRAWLPVTGGSVGGGNLRGALIEAAGWPLWERWLHDYLGWDERKDLKSFPEIATVAVCTRDRPAELRRCLEAIHPWAKEGHEILVVDNCPRTELTRRLVKGYDQVRYIREDNPGLNFARNRALREARHKIVAFTDDDAIPEAAWLANLLRNFNNPRTLCVTGLTMPLELETQAQEWFERYSPFGRGFMRIVYDGANQRPAVAGRIGAGANMALRRNVLDCIGPFDECLDGGTPTMSGGDTEIFSRILARGYCIVYDPAALSWHCHRRTWEELVRTLYGYGVGTYAFWTRSLLIEGEWSVLKVAWNWFFHYQLRAVARSLLKRPGSIPLHLLLAELRGCAWGPLAYLLSRRFRSRIRAYDQ